MRRGRKEKQEEPGGMLSRKMLSDARVIAKEERIRDVQRLVTQDGGRASRWVKKSSPQFEVAGERLITIGTSITALADSRQDKCE